MAYSFQTFSVAEILAASKMNQIEVNIRDHVHGSASVTGGFYNPTVTNELIVNTLSGASTNAVRLRLGGTTKLVIALNAAEPSVLLKDVGGLDRFAFDFSSTPKFGVGASPAYPLEVGAGSILISRLFSTTSGQREILRLETASGGSPHQSFYDAGARLGFIGHASSIKQNMLIASDEGSVVFHTVGISRWSVNTTGHFLPAGADRDIGTTTSGNGIRHLYADGTLNGVSLNVSSGATLQGGVDAGGTGTFLKTKVVSLGDWNMDATPGISFNTGSLGISSFGNIRNVCAQILDDALMNLTALDFHSAVSSIAPAGDISVSSGVIALSRTTGSFFDAVEYNATSFNRGFMTIWYV